ncbi:MAG: hypothetical protein NPIRA06_25450 [Nitrospirales bacterium]|nr:MAG: hypothetical protein NPIRA06_25450 [Nitrospirales bacterium]
MGENRIFPSPLRHHEILLSELRNTFTINTLIVYTVRMALPSDLSFSDSLKSDRRQAFYEHHKRIALAMILIVFLLPLIGVFMSGLSGAISGVVISVLSFYLAPYALLKLGQWFVHS